MQLPNLDAACATFKLSLVYSYAVFAGEYSSRFLGAYNDPP